MYAELVDLLHYSISHGQFSLIFLPATYQILHIHILNLISAFKNPLGQHASVVQKGFFIN